MGGEKTVRVNADLFSLAGDNKYAAMLSDRWQGKGGLKDDCSMFVDYSPKVFMPLIDSHAAIADRSIYLYIYIYNPLAYFLYKMGILGPKTQGIL